MEQKNDAKRKNELDILFGSNSDIDANIMLFGEGQNYSFNNYYILNKEWYDRYIQSLISGSKENLFLLSDFLFPDLKEKKADINNELIKFLLPTNFVLINEKSANMISEYFEANEKIEIKKLCHEVLIYGECIIIKSNLKPNVLYVCLKKKEEKKKDYDTIYENYINYIFQFKSKEDMENEIKYMKSSNNFKDYLKFKNLEEYNNNLNTLEIYNDNSEFIGNIIYNSNENIELSSTLNLLQKNRVLEKSKDSEKIISKINPYFKSIILGLSRFEKLIQGFKGIIETNRNLKLTKYFYFFLEGIPKGDMSDNSIEKEFINSIKTQNHENIINDIFDKLDSEINPYNKNIPINVQLNQTAQTTAENNFKLIHKNPSFIENFCFITFQKKKFCENCKSTKYQYYYNNYFTIDLNEKENNNQKSLKDILLGVKNIFEKCNDCNNDKCKTEIRVDEFPPILIIIIKGNNNEKLTLKNNFILYRNNYTPFYKLSCCVEEKTNNFFYSQKGNWCKFDINTNDEEKITQESIERVKPSILFFNANFKEPRLKNITQMNQINNNNKIPVQNINSNNNNLFNNNMNMNHISNNNNNQINMNKNNNFNMNMNNNLFNMNNKQFNQNNNQFFGNYNNNQINNNNQFNQFGNNNLNLNLAKSKSDNLINNKMNWNNQFNMNMNNKNINNNQFNMNINNNINNNQFNRNNQNNFNNMNWNKNNKNMNMMNNNFNNNLLINQNNNNNFNNNNLFMNQNNNNFRNQEKPKPKGTIIFITFTFEKNKEQIYLDADDGESFENILYQLEDKYNWLRKIIKKTYFLEGEEIINHKKTLKELKIVENSDISIRA